MEISRTFLRSAIATHRIQHLVAGVLVSEAPGGVEYWGPLVRGERDWTNEDDARIQAVIDNPINVSDSSDDEPDIVARFDTVIAQAGITLR